MGEIFLIILENVGAAVLPPKFSRDSEVFLLGSSNKTKVKYFGLSIGKVPINEVITFFQNIFHSQVFWRFLFFLQQQLLTLLLFSGTFFYDFI